MCQFCHNYCLGDHFFAPLLLVKNITDLTFMGAYHFVPEKLNLNIVHLFPFHVIFSDVWELHKIPLSHITNSLWVYKKHCDVGTIVLSLKLEQVPL